MPDENGNIDRGGDKCPTSTGGRQRQGGVNTRGRGKILFLFDILLGVKNTWLHSSINFWQVPSLVLDPPKTKKKKKNCSPSSPWLLNTPVDILEFLLIFHLKDFVVKSQQKKDKM